jgi:hypothetical protein
MVGQLEAKKLLDLNNFICGRARISPVTKLITNFKNQEYAQIYSATDSDLREIKRTLFALQNDLKKIPLSKIVALIQQSAKYYFKNSEDIDHLSNLTGSTITFLKKSIATRKSWCLNIEKFVKLCFGGSDYSAIPVVIDKRYIGCKSYSPSGSVIALLPSNSDEESLYIIVQVLLSKSPCLIRTSSKMCSNFSSIKYLEALSDAIDDTQDPTLDVLRKAVSIINLFNVPAETNIIEKLAIKNATYVVFGSNETITEVSNQLKELGPRKIIKMGTGCCASFILIDCALDLAVQEVCQSACINNGNECISTTIVYIEDEIYAKALDKIKKFADEMKFSDPLDEKSYLGCISLSSRIEISTYLQQKFYNYNIIPSDISGMIVMELETNDNHFDELPGPVLLIKKIENSLQGVKRLQDALTAKNIFLNLSVSIFTKDINNFYSVAHEVPSYNCKFNKGTHNMNMFLEHQGNYLLKELMEFKLIEI